MLVVVLLVVVDVYVDVLLDVGHPPPPYAVPDDVPEVEAGVEADLLDIPCARGARRGRVRGQTAVAVEQQQEGHSTQSDEARSDSPPPFP